MVAAMDGPLLSSFRHRPASLLNATRPETPSVSRRSSAPSSFAFSRSVSLSSLPASVTSSRPASHERTARLTREPSFEKVEEREECAVLEAAEQQPQQPQQQHLARELKDGIEAQTETVEQQQQRQLDSETAQRPLEEAGGPQSSAPAGVLPLLSSPPTAEPVLPDEEKQQLRAAETEAPSPSTAAAEAAASVSPPQAQLESAVSSLLYLCERQQSAALSASQLPPLFSLAAACFRHLTSASHIAQLAAAFLSFTASGPEQEELRTALLPALLSSLFSLSRDESNDALLQPLLPLLLSLLSSPASALSCLLSGSRQQLMCLFSLLVNLTTAAEGQRRCAEAGWLQWLVRMSEEEEAGGGAEQQRVTVCMEAASIMRNIACAPAAHRCFLAPLPAASAAAPPPAAQPPSSTLSPRAPPACIDWLCALLPRYAAQPGLLLSVMRILSKLSLHADCREAMSRRPEAMQAMVCLLHGHHPRLPLCLRLCFTLGNLTAHNDDNRFVVADAVVPSSSPSSSPAVGLSVLLSLLQRTDARDGKLRAALAERPGSARHAMLRRENAALLTQLVRLLANVAIHPDVGERITRDERARLLLNLLTSQPEGQDAQHELQLNALSCCSNLSFYPLLPPAPAACFLFHPLPAALAAVTPFLFSPLPQQEELLAGTCRLLANLTRSAAVRQLLFSSGAHQAVLLLLLLHPSRSVLHACAGLLLNLTADEDGRRRVLHGGGEGEGEQLLVRLLEAGQGPADEEDEAEAAQEAATWELRALLAKVACNLREADGLRSQLTEQLRQTMRRTLGLWLQELQVAPLQAEEAASLSQLLAAVVAAC